jgi:hypothetical protein
MFTFSDAKVATQPKAQHHQSRELAAVEAKEWVMAADQCPDVPHIVKQQHRQPDPAHGGDRERQIAEVSIGDGKDED